jgi:N-acetylneuraminate synthase
VGLNVLRELGERYRRPVGFSDHTQTESASIAAATIGASVIEKHLTFSRDMYGSDAKFASTPEEFMRISTGVKDVWNMLSNPVDKDNINFYHDMKLVFQKSVAVRCDLTSGHELLHKDLTLLKPGSGISPSELESVVGRILKRDKLSGEILLHEDLI